MDDAKNDLLAVFNERELDDTNSSGQQHVAFGKSGQKSCNITGRMRKFKPDRTSQMRIVNSKNNVHMWTHYYTGGAHTHTLLGRYKWVPKYS